jgi:hypothetical protein
MIPADFLLRAVMADRERELRGRTRHVAAKPSGPHHARPERPLRAPDVQLRPGAPAGVEAS